MAYTKLESNWGVMPFGFSAELAIRFFDEGKLIVVANGFQKKSQKTPKSGIGKALVFKQEYEREK
jgi:hypothetical protein